jgi:hypothetical protein
MKAMTWRGFGAGLLGAVINSVSNAGSLMLADPNTFNPFGGGDWRKLTGVMIVSGLVGAFLWLKQHPLPGSEEE